MEGLLHAPGMLCCAARRRGVALISCAAGASSVLTVSWPRCAAQRPDAGLGPGLAHRLRRRRIAGVQHRCALAALLQHPQQPRRSPFRPLTAPHAAVSALYGFRPASAAPLRRPQLPAVSTGGAGCLPACLACTPSLLLFACDADVRRCRERCAQPVGPMLFPRVHPTPPLCSPLCSPLPNPSRR